MSDDFHIFSCIAMEFLDLRDTTRGYLDTCHTNSCLVMTEDT